MGWRLSKTGMAKVAAAALEEALRSRGIDAKANELTLRSDNGLVFGAKPVRGGSVTLRARPGIWTSTTRRRWVTSHRTSTRSD